MLKGIPLVNHFSHIKKQQKKTNAKKSIWERY